VTEAEFFVKAREERSAAIHVVGEIQVRRPDAMERSLQIT
jgi:hypothetical protein